MTSQDGQLRVIGEMVQYRYLTDSTWTDLLPVDVLEALASDQVQTE